MKLLLVYLLLSVLSVSTIVASNESTCDTLSGLLKALYETKDNVLQLTKAFYPRQQPSEFFTIIYQFENATSNDSECSVTYVWAMGGFLLIQPPTIFQFMSLLFNLQGFNYETELTLTLPSYCRGLVQQNATGSCSCDEGDEDILGVLTQQVLSK